MFDMLGILNAFSTYIQLTMGLSGCNPIVSQGTSVYCLFIFKTLTSEKSREYHDDLVMTADTVLRVLDPPPNSLPIS